MFLGVDSDLLNFLLVFRQDLRGKMVVFHCDNQSVIHALNLRTCREKDVMKLIRAMVLLSLFNDIRSCAQHIPGCDNIQADRLSQFQVSCEDLLRWGLSAVPVAINPEWLPRG